MANEPNATPPAATTATGGEVKVRARRGYEYVDGDRKFTFDEPVAVSEEEAKKLLTKAPDYLVRVEEKE